MPDRRLRTLLSRLDQLVALELDAVHACEHASGELDDPVTRRQISMFARAHQRQLYEISECTVMLGAKPRRRGTIRGRVLRRLAGVGRFVSGPAALLAVVSAEDKLQERYAKALYKFGQSEFDRVRTVLQRGLANEGRHRSWLAIATPEAVGIGGLRLVLR